MFARLYNFKKWYNKTNLTILVKTRLEFSRRVLFILGCLFLIIIRNTCPPSKIFLFLHARLKTIVLCALLLI